MKVASATVILNATQGTRFGDPAFLSRLAEARAAGLEVGADHFLDANSPPNRSRIS